MNVCDLRQVTRPQFLSCKMERIVVARNQKVSSRCSNLGPGAWCHSAFAIGSLAVLPVLSPDHTQP